MREVVTESVKVVPPALITATSFFGIEWQIWVYILTAIYTLIQILRQGPKVYTCMLCFIEHRRCSKKCQVQ